MQKKTLKKNRMLYFRICLSFAVLVFLVYYIDAERLVFLIKKVRIQYIWQAFLLILLNYFVAAVRWSFLLRHFKIKQRIRDSFRFYLVGGFYSIVFPGSIGEDAVRLGLSLRSQGNSKALLATSILFERTCGLVVILLMAASAALIVPVLLADESSKANLIVGIAVGVLAIFVLFFLILKISPDSWFGKRDAILNWKQRLLSLLGHYRSLSFRSVSVLLLLSVVAHLLDFIGSFYLSRAININQPFSVFLLIMPIVSVFTILPITIGGIGVREGLLAYFLAKVGVLPSDAILLGLVIYLNRLLVAMIGGIIQFIEKRNLSSQEHAGHT